MGDEIADKHSCAQNEARGAVHRKLLKIRSEYTMPVFLERQH